MSFNSSIARESVEAVDIRRTALRAFRDHLVLPIVDRVRVLWTLHKRVLIVLLLSARHTVLS